MTIITESDCQNILQNISNHSGKVMKFRSFEVKPFSEKTTGFIACHFRLVINVEVNGDKDISLQTIKFFIKTVPNSPSHARYVEGMGAFHKELQNFNKLLPLLQNISKNLGNCWSPQCYLIKSKLLALEDLTDNGFEMMESCLLDYKHLKVAAQTLGYFHGASVIFESTFKNDDKRWNIKKMFSDCVKENTYVDDPYHVRYKWYNSSVKAVVKIIKTLKHKYTEDQIKGIVHKLLKFKEDIKEAFKTSETKVNVFCHGDLWMNNIMFRYKDGIPVEGRLVDFQFTRYAPGCLDLVTLLFTSVDKATRDKYEPQIVEEYTKSFESHLRKASVPIPNINMAEDVKTFKPAGCWEGILFEMVTRMDQEAVQDLLNSGAEEFFLGDKSKIVIKAFERDAVYRMRLTTLIEELIDDYLFNNTLNFNM